MHREFFNGLSDETRYNGMMNALRELSPAMMVHSPNWTTPAKWR